jgi:hypothetical protein
MVMMRRELPKVLQAGQKSLEEAQTHLNELVRQREESLVEIEDQLKVFKANLNLHKVASYRALNAAAIQAHPNSLARELQKQEVAISTAIAQQQVLLAAEKRKLKAQQTAYAADLNQVSAVTVAKVNKLQQLKAELAQVIRGEIRKLKTAAMHEEKIGKTSSSTNFTEFDSVKKFNRQLKGFARINERGQLILCESLKQDFATTSLEEVQEQVATLLRNANSTSLVGQSDTLKQLIAELDKLAMQERYRRLVGSTAVQEQPFMNGDINFSWASSARQLQAEVSGPAVTGQLEPLSVKHFGSSQAIGKLQASLDVIRDQLGNFNTLNKEFEKQNGTKVQMSDLGLDISDDFNPLFDGQDELTALKETQFKVLQQFDGVNNTALSAHYTHARFSLVPREQFDSILKGVNLLRAKLVEFGKVTKLSLLSEQDKQLLSKGGLDLFVQTMQSSYDLLDNIQKIQVASEGQALHPMLSQQTAAAILKQAALVKTLVEQAPVDEVGQEEKYEEANLFVNSSEKRFVVPEIKEELAAFDRDVSALPVASTQVSKLCVLMMNALENKAFWNKQVAFSSLRSSMKAPTGVEEMLKLRDRFYRDHGAGWVNDPMKAAQRLEFLEGMKAIANGRLNHKICGFFNQRREPQTSQFYKFLTNLNVSDITSASFAAAKKVDAIETARLAYVEQLSRPAMVI